MLIGLIVYLVLLWVKHLLIAAIVVFRLLWLALRDGPRLFWRAATPIAVTTLAVLVRCAQL